LGDAAFASDGGAGGDAHERGTRLHQFGAEGQPPVAGIDDFQKIAGSLRPNEPQTPVQDEPGDQPAGGRQQNPRPRRQHFHDLHRIARLRQKKALDELRRIEKKHIHQPADHPHHTGEYEVKSLLIQDKFMTPAQRELKVTPEKVPRTRHRFIVRPSLHSKRLVG